MTFDKWSLKSFLTIDEIAKRLSAESKDDTTVSWSDVLSLALDGHLALVVKVPPKTHVWGAAKDGRRPTIEGIWSVVMEGERGSNARRAIDRDYRRLADLPAANDEGIDGIWVERDGEQWKLDPYSNLPKEVLEHPVVLGNLKSRNPAYAVGCILGARTAAVEQLLAQDFGSYKKPVEATWQDVTLRFLSEHRVQIVVHGKVLPATNYEELGFEDNRKKEQPNMAWETLVEVAERKDHRLLLREAIGSPGRRRIQNQTDAINKTLRAALKGRGYEIPQKPEPLQTDQSKASAESKPTRVSADYYEPNFRIEWVERYK